MDHPAIEEQIRMQEEIELLALSFWEAEGRPQGRDLEHWLRAEVEVKARHAQSVDAAGA